MNVIYCSGGNKRLAEIAMEAGMLYGVRQDYVAYFPPVFMDVHWEDYDWDQYLERVRELATIMALVPDYLSPDQRDTMIERCELLRGAGVQVVMVCPKFGGAVKDIPVWCRVAISVPSEYAGFLPPVGELAGRELHLLGGSPQRQMELYRYYQHFGVTVVSVDCNAHQKAAWMGTYFTGRKWKNNGPGAMDSFTAFRRSCESIVRMWS